VELKDFEHVSDGEGSLVVSPIQQVLVTPAPILSVPALRRAQTMI